MIQRLLEKYTTNEIAEHLYVAKGTVKRWIDTSTIPDAYTFDIMKLLGDTIDYSLYNFNTKDQFYTPISTALHCYSRTCEILKKLGEDETQYTYIEPSAGSGNFLNALPSDRTIALDVEPRNSISIAGAARVINKQDYMDWSPKSDDKKYIVIGNPPFGLRGNLALRFINHSYEFADFVCFILPQLFESDGKGVPRRRVVGYNLIHSEKIPSTFYYPDDKEICVNTIFQIWSKYNVNDEYRCIPNTTTNKYVKIYSLSDGSTPSSTRNKEMLYKCHMYLPSTCFGVENMRYYENFEDLPGRRGYGVVFKENINEFIDKFKSIDWSIFAFQSTNSAYNIRSSQIMSALI